MALKAWPGLGSIAYGIETGKGYCMSFALRQASSYVPPGSVKAEGSERADCRRAMCKDTTLYSNVLFAWFNWSIPKNKTTVDA